MHCHTALLSLMLFAAPSSHADNPTNVPVLPSNGTEMCSYSNYKWNINLRRAVNHERINKPRHQLTAEERDSGTGCTVCEQDQIELRIAGVPSFTVCKHLAKKFQHAIAELKNRQAPLLDIVGYRVGMTRGNIDAAGNRTGFSNHSFGIAIDINTDHNGLYDGCVQFGPHCRLIKGGPWRPDQPASLTADSLIVVTLKRYGMHWGGEIVGNQKDFMHFSPTGY